MAKLPSTPKVTPGQDRFVMLKGGQVFEWALVQRLLAIESRGGTFHVEPDETIKLSPASAAQGDDLAVLKERKSDVLRILAYIDRICRADAFVESLD